MVLNDNEIRELVAKGLLIIDPYSDDSLSPASYDFSIGSYQSLNMPDKHRADCLQTDKSVEIFPGESFLASTVEILGCPLNITGEIVSKSSTSRKGLNLFSPGWVDPGFIGQLTVAMKNETYKPIVLKYGQKLWQVVFDTCTPAGQSYQGHYQNSEGIVEDKSGDATIGL